MSDAIRDVLDFWFAEAAEAQWYEPSTAFDRAVADQLGTWHERAAAGELEAWQASAEGCLALCLLLDQAPRNLFRGTARAFATDAQALAVALRALEAGFDRQFDAKRRQFLYMPLMHSEQLVDQDHCIALYKSPEMRDGLEYAIEHAGLIRRFGRFPHRNAALGRPNSAEEEAYLAEGDRHFGQGPVSTDPKI